MIKAIRILVYEGTEIFVTRTLNQSYITSDRPLDLPQGKITEILREIIRIDKEVKTNDRGD